MRPSSGYAPVRRATGCVAKRRKGLLIFRLFHVGDTERVIAIGFAGIGADGLFQEIRGLRVLLIEKQGTAGEE